MSLNFKFKVGELLQMEQLGIRTKHLWMVLDTDLQEEVYVLWDLKPNKIVWYDYLYVNARLLKMKTE